MFKQYIGGKLVEGKGKKLDVYNPANGELIETLSCADAAQAKEALAAAEKAFKTWKNVPVYDRANWMLKLRDACLEDYDTLVELVMAESGRTYEFAKADVNWFITSMQYYGDEAKRTHGEVLPCPTPGSHYLVTYEPIGVTVGHLAWNYPLGNASVKLAPAVASGCTCIIKPSSETPLATLHIGALAEKIGFPEGVINIVAGPSGEVARTLNESTIPKMISCIGSYETGLKIMEQSATSIKRYSFELGGNAPVVVMPDADLDATAANIVAKKTGFAGQTCVNYNRIYIHKDIYETMCEKIANELSKVSLGSGKDKGYIMGPMINKNARDHMLTLIKDATDNGATLVMGGTIPAEFEKGAFITPALLRDVNDDMLVSKEEIFGPIIPVQPFETLDEAIEKSNNTIFGLSAYYFGHDAKEMNEYLLRTDAGEIFVNGAGGNEFVPHSGHKQSGIGADKSKWSLADYYQIKFLSINP